MVIEGQCNTINNTAMLLALIFFALNPRHKIFANSLKEDMILVPKGEFIMGEAGYAGIKNDDAVPMHLVYLDAYRIDKFEVTNTQFEKFKPLHKNMRDKYSRCDLCPVVYVSWYDARDYCVSIKKQLPTEAQWEKAARGTDVRTYPWGEGWVIKKGKFLANFNQPLGHGDRFQYTSPVGSFPEGRSFYGLYDMAGNVLEWTKDWFSERYYEKSPFKNPKGAKYGRMKVLRGGSFKLGPKFLTTTYRFRYFPGYVYDFATGFRCAM